MILRGQFMFFLLQLAIARLRFGIGVVALAFTHEGWRIAMSIGREPGTGMPRDWASSGCRLPVIVKCDFRQEDDTSNRNIVVPLTGNVRFTGPDGEVVSPVESGEWTLTDGRDLSFTLNFPQTLVRRDVTLDGTIRCEGLLYSLDDLEGMNGQFYEARDDLWDAGEAIDSIDRRKNAPKKWNPDTNKWERRYKDEDFLSQLKKQVNLMNAKRKEKMVNSKRPILKELSLDCGAFPGIQSDVYFRKGGKVFLKVGLFREHVIGTWFAEPINDKPLSYY